MTTNMRFVILGDDKGSAAFDRFARSVDGANKSVDRNQAALKKQQEQQDSTSKSLLKLTGSVTGFGDVAGVASSEGTVLTKALAAMNVATGVAEPALAGLVVTAGGMAAAFASAGAGAVAYKVALTPLLTEAKNVTTAQTKLSDAQAKAQSTYKAALAGGASVKTAEAARTRALTKAQDDYKTAVEGTPAPVRKFAASLKDTQDAYQKWANTLARPVLAPLQRGLALVKPVLHDISPLVLAASKAIGILEGQFAKSIQGGGLERLVTTVLPHVEPSILNLGHSVGNVAVGIGGIVAAFLPMAGTVTSGVEQLTVKFRQWATSLPSHTGFQSLMTTFKTETPLAVGVLKNLVVIIKNVAAATTGLASPANSKALLQILTPVTQIMAQLTANQGLVRAVLYFGLLQGSLNKVSLAAKSARTGVAAFTTGGTIISGATKMYGVIGRLAGGYKNGAVAASAFSGTAGTIGGKIATIVSPARAAAAGMGEMTVAERAATVAAEGMAAVNPVVWAAGAVIALTAFAVIVDREKTAIDGLTGKIEASSGAVGYNIAGYKQLSEQLSTAAGRQNTVAQTSKNLGVVGGGLYGQLAKVRAVTTDVGDASADTDAKLNRFTGRLGTLQGQFNLTQAGAIRLAEASGVAGDKFTAAGAAGQAAFGRVQKYASGLTATQLASYRAATASQQFGNQLSIVNGKLLAGQGDLLAWRQAQQQATQAINDSSTGLKGNGAAALAAKQDVLQATQQAIQFAQSQNNSATGTKRATGIIQDQIKWLQQHAAHSKFATQEVDALRQALAKIKSEHADISVTGTGKWHVVEGVTDISTGGGGTSHIHKWTGGPVRGPGGMTDDKAGLYALSNKEWVIRAHAAASYGDPAMAAVNAGHATILYPGMATGGAVTGAQKGTPKGTGAFATGKYAQTVQIVEAATAAATAAGIKSAQLKANAGGFGIGKGGSQSIAKYAAGYGTGLNHPYVWGGNSPSGWDCSGFTSWVYHHFGYSPPRTSQTQQTWAKPSKETPGALVFFYGTGGTASHVGISLGGGSYVGADNESVGTVIHSSGGNSGFGVPPTGFAAGGKVGGNPVKKNPPPPRLITQPISLGGGGGGGKLARDQALLAKYQNQLAAKEKTAATHIRALRIPLDRDQLKLLQGGLSASQKKALQASVGKQEKAISKYRDKATAEEDHLQKEISILQRLIKSDPKPPPGPPFKLPPGFGGGTKAQRLVLLAKTVTAEKRLEKQSTGRLRQLRLPLEREELYLLTHPNLPASKKASLQAQIKAQEKGISKYRKTVATKEGANNKEISILRALTGYPKATKYGGSGAVTDPGDGGDDGSGGGDTGGGGTSSGPPPIAPPPMPAWMVAAGLGGPTAGGPAGPGGFPFLGGTALPGMDPVGSRYTGPRRWETSDGGDGDDITAAVHQMRTEMVDVLGQVHDAVRRVGPSTARGMDRSMNSMAGNIASKFQ